MLWIKVFFSGDIKKWFGVCLFAMFSFVHTRKRPLKYVCFFVLFFKSLHLLRSICVFNLNVLNCLYFSMHSLFCPCVCLLVSNSSSTSVLLHRKHLCLTSFWLLVPNSSSYTTVIRWEHLCLTSLWLLVSNSSSYMNLITWEHLCLTSVWLLVSNSPSCMKAIRWEHLYLPPFWLRQDEGEATLQLALISDGLTSYALVYYAFGEMNWTYRGLWSYVIMGVSDGTVDNYQRNLYTKTKRAYRIDGVPGNTGKTRSSGTRTRHR